VLDDLPDCFFELPLALLRGLDLHVLRVPIEPLDLFKVEAKEVKTRSEFTHVNDPCFLSQLSPAFLQYL